MFWSLLTSIHLLPAFFAGIAPLEHADDAGKHTSDTRAAVSVPRLIYKVEPEYSEEARNSGHQGTVVLYLEVDPSGKPRNLRVIRKLGLGLDEKAIEAVGKWKFLPGYKDGGPVTSAATVEVNFRLLPDMNSLIERARKGEIAAQFELGLMYYRGEGGPADFRAAAQWYHKAADGGLAPAQNNLGVMYQKGQGVAQDYVQAVKWYRRAAGQGNSSAQANLARMYEQGRGVAQDYGQAAKWYHKAAKRELLDGYFGLARMYHNGLGVQQDLTKATEQYREAAERGFAPAQYELGLMFAKGHGTGQNLAVAHMWLELAQVTSDPDARKLAYTALQTVKDRMTTEDVIAARRLAASWQPKPSHVRR